MMYKYLETNNM